MSSNPLKAHLDSIRTVVTPRAPKVRNADHPHPGKRGLVGLTLYLHPDAHKQLKDIAEEGDTQIKLLLLEGVNLIFQQHGRKPIA